MLGPKSKLSVARFKSYRKMRNNKRARSMPVIQDPSVVVGPQRPGFDLQRSLLAAVGSGRGRASGGGEGRGRVVGVIGGARGGCIRSGAGSSRRGRNAGTSTGTGTGFAVADAVSQSTVRMRL